MAGLLSTDASESAKMPVMLTILIILFVAISGCEILLEQLNLRHQQRHGRTIPPAFAGALDQHHLGRAVDYALAKGRVALSEELFGKTVLALFIFAGLLPRYDRLIVGVSGSFVADGVLFVTGLVLATTLLGIPFSLWKTFGVEARFGFNTTTLRLWCSDFVKSLLLGLVLLGLLCGGALALIRWSPLHWWLWVWGLFAVTTLLLMYLSPLLIEPLFFKFKPVTRGDLEVAINALMTRAGLQVERVSQVDASRRSRHSNAYFTGIGKVKRIVLFDTLLEQLDDAEILAVLAHEVGHWKKKHIFKRLLWTELLALIVCYAGYRLLDWGRLPELLGLDGGSFYLQVVILLFGAGLLAFPFTPLSSWRSRRDENQADDFACALLGDGEALASGLIKLSAENFANLHPHPCYAWFYSSHPPIVARVRRLRRSR